MATRLYFPSTGTPPFTDMGSNGPSGSSTAGSQRWNIGNTAYDILPLAQSRSGTPLALGTARTPTSATTTGGFVDRLYISDPLQAQTVSGTMRAAIAGIESSGTMNAWLTIIIRVISGDGLSTRGVLTNGSQGTTATLTSTAEAFEYPNSGGAASRMRQSSAAAETLSSVAAQAGDRVCVEIGSRRAGASGTSFNVRLEYGDPAAGTEYTTVAQTGLVPWIEFSQDLAFEAPPASGPEPGRLLLAC